jgi:two-component system sensor histidine kinase KdpD
LASPLRDYLDLANIVMLFLLAVLLVALRAGRGPAVFAAIVSVLLFDFFFVPPRFSLAVGDAQYAITLGVMLAVALITAQLATTMGQKAEVAARRERETRSLYELARDLAGAASTGQVAAIAERFMQAAGGRATLLLPDAEDVLTVMGEETGRIAHFEQRLALVAYRQGQIVAVNALDDADHPVSYVPLKAPMRTRGVLVVTTARGSRSSRGPMEAMLSTVASLVAIAVERLHYVDVANQAQMEMASERLRTSILSALSHDLRTPLTAIVGLADSLTVQKPPLPEAAHETAAAIRDQAARLCGMVTNLLDMARLAAGNVKPRKEWQVLEEVAGAAVQLLGRSLAGHRVAIELPFAMPLIEFDAVLIERVLCNLLENAAKYSAPGSAITIGARLEGGFAHLCVADEGPGFPEGRQEEVFAMSVRGEPESSAPGAGFGTCHQPIDCRGARWDYPRAKPATTRSAGDVHAAARRAARDRGGA